MHPHERLLLLRTTGLTLLAASCGGGGGSGQAVVRDPRPPTVTVLFPPARSKAEPGALFVRGTASDPDGITQLTVEGVAATSTDGFATWSAALDLADGLHDLAVDTRDQRGTRTSAAARFLVEVEPLLTSAVNDLAVDAAKGVILVSDQALDRVLAFDPASGAYSLFSGSGRGTGPDLVQPRAVDFDVAGGRLVVVDEDSSPSVVVIERSGDREIVSSDTVGTGPLFSVPLGLAVDPFDSNRAFVTAGFGSGGRDTLFSVDLNKGTRRIISDVDNGTGPLFLDARGCAVIAPGDLVAVLDSSLQALVSVTIATGDRTIISDFNRGSGPFLINPSDVVVSADGTRAFVTDNLGASVAILEIDLLTGDRTIVVDSASGAGPPLFGSTNVAFLDDLEQALVAIAGAPQLFAIEVATGDHAELSVDVTGSGPPVFDTVGADVDHAAGRVFVSNPTFGSIVEIDLATGDRTLVSGPGRGAGPDMSPLEIAFEGVEGSVIVATFDNRELLLRVDLATGDRTVLSDASRGSGPDLELIFDVVVDAVRRQAFVLDAGAGASQRVLAIDLDDGDRTLVSDDTRGGGPLLDGGLALVLDAARNRALFIDIGANEVIAINLVSGDRTLVTGGGVGSGPELGIPEQGVMAPTGDALIVLDRDPSTSADRLMRVDLVTGDRSVFTPFQKAVPFQAFVQTLVSFGEDDEEVLLLDRDFGALLRFDVASRSFVIQSQ